MVRTYTMRLKVTRRQDKTLQCLLAQLCELYNMALEQRRNAYKELGISVGYYEQQLQLKDMRSGIEEYRAFPAAVQRDPLRRLDRAFKGFFRRCKSGDKPGFHASVLATATIRLRLISRTSHLNYDGLRIVKLGHFRVKTHYKLRRYSR